MHHSDQTVVCLAQNNANWSAFVEYINTLTLLISTNNEYKEDSLVLKLLFLWILMLLILSQVAQF